jgi:fructosamine-3-kinase
MTDEKGDPLLIDPAVYVGCNEADIAMTELFGGFDRRFYESYFSVIDQVPGYSDRRDLYNLYHLTNHLNLFGSTYLSAVVRTIEKYQ